jgi:hypothetical protein
MTTQWMTTQLIPHLSAPANFFRPDGLMRRSSAAQAPQVFALDSKTFAN